MRHVIFLILAIAIFAVGLSFASEVQSPGATTTVTKAMDTKTFTGKVESVTSASPINGTKSEIIIVDEKGNKSTFLVKSTTTIYDVDWKVSVLEKIKKDDRIKVRYVTTKEGVNEATLINLLKQ